MKKFTYLLAMVAAMVGFTSCEDDKEPVIQTPTEFKLLEPALQNQYLKLEEGNTIDIYCNQPNYGVSLLTNYILEAAVDPSFANYVELEPTTAYQTKITVKAEDLAIALCKLNGYEKEEDWDSPAATKVYFKAVAWVDGVESSRIESSNYVSLNKVEYYFAVPQPGIIWVVGDVTAWNVADPVSMAPYQLKEADDAIGSKIYRGTLNIGASPTFRFYTNMDGNWDTGSIGAAGGTNSDTPVEFPNAFAGGAAFDGGLANTKDSFKFPNWQGGEIAFVVDLNSMVVVMTPQ
jgi:hypothetical protein